MIFQSDDKYNYGKMRLMTVLKLKKDLKKLNIFLK